MPKLTALAAKALTKPGRYTDGNSLYLLVKDSGAKSWVLRYRQGDKTREMGLGAFPDVSVAQARQAAAAARDARRQGSDPITSKRAPAAAEVAHTFRAAAEGLMQDRRAAWRSEKHLWQWEQTLQAHAYPVIGHKLVADLTTDDVMAVLRPIWPRIPETASRVRGRIEAVIDAARARGWCSGENPARWKGHLATRLPSPTRVRQVEHYPSLPYQRAAEFMAALRAQVGIGARALELSILTASRAGMVRGMTWGEIDLERRIWLVPGRRMKGGKPHRVPLSAGAVAVLHAVQQDRITPQTVVFPNTAGKPMSLMAMTMVLRRMNGDRVPDAQPTWLDEMSGEPIVPHGFRSTFRVWAGEMTPYPREVVEAALAHVVAGKVERTYARTDLLEKRRPLMEDWSAFLAGVRQGVEVGAETVHNDERGAAELLGPDRSIGDEAEKAGLAETA